MLSTHTAQAARALTRAQASPSLRPAGSWSLHFRQYHQASALRRPYKDDQDRESLKPRNTDGTKSGSDEDAASHEDAAFNPKETTPSEEKHTAGKGGSKGNPLEVSGANQELSKPRGDNPGGEKKPQAGKKKKSGGSSGTKQGKA